MNKKEINTLHRDAICVTSVSIINPLNAELNRICHLLALLGADHILHVSRIKVKLHKQTTIRIPVSPRKDMYQK
jgi:hypothetical protein